MASPIELATNNPSDEDFTKSQLALMKETRTEQNKRLLDLLTGERDTVPVYEYTWQPETLNPPKVDAEQFTAWAANVIQGQDNNAYQSELQRRGNLRERKSINFPDHLPFPGQLQDLHAGMKKGLETARADAAAGHCLFADESFLKRVGWARGYRRLYGADVFTRAA